MKKNKRKKLKKKVFYFVVLFSMKFQRTKIFHAYVPFSTLPKIFSYKTENFTSRTSHKCSLNSDFSQILSVAFLKLISKMHFGAFSKQREINYFLSVFTSRLSLFKTSGG